MPPQKDPTLCEIIRKNIRELREKKYPDYGGQTKCAAEFGVNVRTWNGWEAGRNIPTEDYQRKLAKFFGISVAQLRGDLPMEYKNTPAVTTGESEDIIIGGNLEAQTIILKCLETQAGLNALARHLAGDKSVTRRDFDLKVLRESFETLTSLLEAVRDRDKIRDQKNA